MITTDADPVLLELRQLLSEARRIRIARDRMDADPDRDAARSAELATVEQRIAELWDDTDRRVIMTNALAERARVLRIVAEATIAQRRRTARERSAELIESGAISAGRELTAGELREIGNLRSDLEAERAWRAQITSARVRDETLDALGAVALRNARRQLRAGLLLTRQMNEIIAEATPALLRGDPLLLVGETGGAKTALAEHLSRVATGQEPELVSGYGDITSAQLIGSHELRASNGATSSIFVPGPLLRAMTEGRPVILDEINAMPPEFLKRLNRILQLRPGDTLQVQEDAGRPVHVAQGFAILATANEQTPHRYRGLDRLSAELVNRFGANGYRVHYPDAGLDYTDFPVENALLAAAAVVDERGYLPSSLSVDELHRVARAAFISQQVFAGVHGEGFDAFVSTEREIDGRPGLEESVLAPRTLVALLQKVVGSAGTVSLERSLTRFVEGVMHREDRRILALIIQGQGFRLG